MFWQADVFIITDDIMVVGYKPDHSDQHPAFTSLLQTAQKCNVKLNFDKLQYKKNEVDLINNFLKSNLVAGKGEYQLGLKPRSLDFQPSALTIRPPEHRHV